MTPFVFSFIVAAIITLVLLSMKHRDHHETNTNYGFKVFFVSLVTTYLVYTFLMSNAVAQEIDVGEPPF